MSLHVFVELQRDPMMMWMKIPGGSCLSSAVSNTLAL